MPYAFCPCHQSTPPSRRIALQDHENRNRQLAKLEDEHTRQGREYQRHLDREAIQKELRDIEAKSKWIRVSGWPGRGGRCLPGGQRGWPARGPSVRACT